MKSKECNRTCYTCANYNDCIKKINKKWFPACVELSCFKTLIEDRS